MVPGTDLTAHCTAPHADVTESNQQDQIERDMAEQRGDGEPQPSMSQEPDRVGPEVGGTLVPSFDGFLAE